MSTVQPEAASATEAIARGAAGRPWLLISVSLVGLAAFFYPMVLPALLPFTDGTTPRTTEAPFLIAIVALGCVIALMLEVSRADHRHQFGSARTVALLGALVAMDAALRFVPSIAGASLIFGLIILVGAVFGPRFGFLMGAMTLLLSAALTGGIGPWLPFQMLGAGWVGLGAGLVGAPFHPTRKALLPLAIYAAICGFAYGALLNLYDWPFLSPGSTAMPGLAWAPGLGLTETVRRYIAFYLTTSLGHDAARAAANVVLVLVLGPAVIRLLRRHALHATWSPLVGPSSQ